MAKKSKSPFDVSLTQEQEDTLASKLCDEIQDALTARDSIIAANGDLDYFYAYYEQQRMGGKAFPGAADLTSYLITETVDSQRARMMKAIFVEPFYIVEGEDPESAKKAPVVEEFHQIQIERERLQSKMGKVLNKALIEGTGILEVTERADKRVVRKDRIVALTLDETGQPILDANGKPELQRDPETGDFIDQQGPGTAKIVSKETVTIRKGPQYRVISLRDFLFLPGHAKDLDEVFAYAKRFTRRLAELKASEQLGIYKNIARLGTTSDKEPTAFETRDGQQVAPQVDDRVEMELWELLVLLDLDEDGIEEWYVCTVSLSQRVLLRCQHDDLGQPRYLAFTPYPRDDSPYGYSLAGHKVLTLAEEHTAIRNMIADRSALATNAPMTRIQGALYDPMEQPFGTGRILDVRAHDELKQLQIADVPNSAIDREQNVLQAKERVSGQNDVAIGQRAETGSTLGETQIRTEQSFVRMDESMGYVRETLEDLGQLRHTIWVRTLEGQAQGMTAPDALVRSLSLRVPDPLENGKITADMIRGNFRFKPRGSVESADLTKEGQNFNNWMQTMGALAAMNPMLQQYWTRPEAVRALIEQGLRVNRVRDRQSFLPPPGPEGDALLAPPPPVPMMGAAPGGPQIPPEVQAILAQGNGAPQ